MNIRNSQQPRVQDNATCRRRFEPFHASKESGGTRI